MKKYLIIILFSFFVSLFLIGTVLAVDVPTVPTAPAPTGTTGGGSASITLPEKPANLPSPALETVIPNIIKIIFAVGEIAFVIVFLVAGVTYITSMGEEAKMEKAKKAITFAIIGIVVVFSAYAIATFIVNYFKNIT